MTLKVEWLPEAERELRKAAAWYGVIRPELATRFLYAVDEAIEAIKANPLQFAVVEKNRHRAGVRRFPTVSISSTR